MAIDLLAEHIFKIRPYLSKNGWSDCLR